VAAIGGGAGGGGGGAGGGGAGAAAGGGAAGAAGAAVVSGGVCASARALDKLNHEAARTTKQTIDQLRNRASDIRLIIMLVPFS
jgi:hypothetical protein